MKGLKKTRAILLHVFWEESPGKMIRYGETSAHIGNDIEPPTDKEMQSILYAAKMEFARLRGRK